MIFTELNKREKFELSIMGIVFHNGTMFKLKSKHKTFKEAEDDSNKLDLIADINNYFGVLEVCSK